MIFPEILGAASPREVLARMLLSGRVPHALLFHGPEGVGKRTVAERFAVSLLCESPGEDGAACGRCAACRKAGHGNHPDLLVTTRLPKAAAKEAAADGDDEPETGEGGDLRAWIVVEQIRALTEHAAYAPREARSRVFLVDPADRMNPAAQNALLKTLEEPPGRAVIILVASRPHVLFPTVRSRCFQLGFPAMAPAALASALAARGMPPVEAGARAALAEGRPGRALTLDLTAAAERRDAVLAMLESLTASRDGLAGMPSFVDGLVGEEEATMLEGLELVEALLRDAARLASGSRSVLHTDVASRLARLGGTLGFARAAELSTLADRLRSDLRFNVNKTLLAETLLAAVAGGPVPA
ncbi:MAG TPA: DNA polymerase III subunit delta' [Candidatus Polarisedimenticolaceae bacterium]|nr:DNA polymerase III subunit delta' [Candidatus Polarisedimenticolaceae bacterium]